MIKRKWTSFLLFGVLVCIGILLLLMQRFSSRLVLASELLDSAIFNLNPPSKIAGEGNLGILLEEIADGFDSATLLTHAGDDRLFVVEQEGLIHIIKDGTVLPTPFLDIRDLVQNRSGEMGLLGLAFHPNYAENGLFFVNYSVEARGSTDGDTAVARYTVSDNPDLANPNGTVILNITQPYENHNGGHLAFGPLDGYLYIASGDGGWGGDPDNRAQDTDQLLGKILRIDVDSASPYAIPVDNQYDNEVWAVGFRNPWRFSFDRLTGDMYLGDVGEDEQEEIDFFDVNSTMVPNYGWPCKEGSLIFPYKEDTPPCDDDDFVDSLQDPIAEYGHELGFAVTGGYIYRGHSYPALAGRYFYGDFGSGRIWSITETSPGAFSQPQLEVDTSILISSFGEDVHGELYVVGHNGRIYRIIHPDEAVPDLSSSTKQSSTPTANPSEIVTYTIHLHNSGGLKAETAVLTDTIPSSLSYVPGTLQATLGAVDDSQAPTLYWSGDLDVTTDITITYQVTPDDVIGSFINQAQISSPSIEPLTLSNALSVPRSALSTTHNDFFFPGTQPNHLSDEIPSPEGCDFCHTEPIYDTWRGSMMAQAGRDPLLWAALAVANVDAPGAGEYCLRCHTPKGWLEGRATAGGAGLNEDDLSAGVACELCHRMIDPLPSTSDEVWQIDTAVRATLTATIPLDHAGSGMIIIDPDDNRRGPFSLSAPHTAFQSNFLGQANNALTESRLCGSCHNVDNPTLSWDAERNQFWPNEMDAPAPSFANGDLFPIERTFDEWRLSAYAATGVYAPQFAGEKPDGIVRSCQDCHMQRQTGEAAESIYDPIFRDCQTEGCLPAHILTGGNTWVPQLLQDERWRLNSIDESGYLEGTILSAREMLQNSATISVTLKTEESNIVATVRVINETGHKLPTGYPEGRRLWLNLRAYNEDNQLVYESGVYDWETAVLSSDPALKIYEAKQGITSELAALLDMLAGESFHFILNNTVIKDNRIPPRGYLQATFDHPGLRPVGATYADGQYWDDTAYNLPKTTVRAEVTLYYQTSSKEYIDFLRTNGGIDGNTVGILWDDSKSPPEVMASTQATLPWANTNYLPIIFGP